MNSGSSREKVTLAGNTCTKISITLFLLSVVLSLSSLYLVVKMSGISSFVLFAAVALFVWHVALAYQIYINMASAYISGEMLIVHYLFGRSKVTEIRSLCSVKSYRIVLLRFTVLKFKLDGKKYRIFTFGIPFLSTDPKLILEQARKVA